jgi:2-aminoadipate transaminase
VGQQPISALMHAALARPHLISLAAGFVDQASLPVSETAAAFDELMAEAAAARAALQYGTNAGYLPLREAVLERLLAADGPSGRAPSVDQVVLTAGSNQLLHLVAEVLCDPGDIVLCAAPSYFVFLGQLHSLQVRAVGVEIDGEGLLPEALEEQLARLKQLGQADRVKAIYVTSYFDNPSTVTLSLARRRRVVEIAKRHGLYVIDDAAYRLLRYAGDDLPGLRQFDDDGSTVITAETFSKSFSPGVRVGWGFLPQALVAPVTGLKAHIDFGSPNLNQHLMATVLKRGLFEPHVDLLRARYRGKLAAMLAALDEHLSGIEGVRYSRPDGGLYVWLELPEGMPAGPGGGLVERALAEGVLYVPGEYCYPPEGPPALANRIRLSFGVQSEANIRRGIEALGRAIRQSG